MDSFLSMIIARLRNVLGFVKFKCHQMMTTTRESARDVILLFVCLCNRSLILYIFTLNSYSYSLTLSLSLSLSFAYLSSFVMVVMIVMMMVVIVMMMIVMMMMTRIFSFHLLLRALHSLASSLVLVLFIVGVPSRSLLLFSPSRFYLRVDVVQIRFLAVFQV